VAGGLRSGGGGGGAGRGASAGRAGVWAAGAGGGRLSSAAASRSASSARRGRGGGGGGGGGRGGRGQTLERGGEPFGLLGEAGQVGRGRRAADLAPQAVVDAAARDRSHDRVAHLLLAQHDAAGIQVAPADRRETAIGTVVAVEREHRHVARTRGLGRREHHARPGHARVGIGLHDAGAVDLDLAHAVARDRHPTVVLDGRGGQRHGQRERREGAAKAGVHVVPW